MEGDKSGLSHLGIIHKSTFQKKYWLLTVFVVSLLALFSGFFGVAHIISDRDSTNVLEGEVCGDGASYNSCSQVKPYFCSEGKLIEMASICDCPEGFELIGENCFSGYHDNSKNIRLKYVLRGKLNYIDFEVYENFSDYIYKSPRFIDYSGNNNLSRADFKLKSINNEDQKIFLLPLVIKIQNITSNKEDQARIAISLVQNIPFGSSNKTYSFLGEQLNHTRYPYEVLYDFQGVCGEKTDLLIFLLKELGYGVSFFYYSPENHEAAGIKCPMKESLMNTGYCFIETTSPSIITDNEIAYSNVGKLSSDPEFYFLSEGESLQENIGEYKDAEKLIRIRNSIDKRGVIGPFYRKTIEDLTYKYGLTEQYYR
jgi:hypothetical protein